MPSSIEAKEIMERAQKENINAYVHGPLAFDNAISTEAARDRQRRTHASETGGGCGDGAVMVR